MQINTPTIIIAQWPPQKCEDCGNFRELRPYGKNAASVCYECAMKDPANADEMCRRFHRGDA